MKNYQKPICETIEVEVPQNLLLTSEESVELGGGSAGIIITPNGKPTEAKIWNS